MTAAGELLTAGLDVDAFAGWLKAQTPRDAVLQERNVLVLKLHHAITIRAGQVVVLGFVQEVRVVVSLVAPEIDLVQQVALHQQAQRSVNRGAGNRRVHAPHTVQQFLGSKVIRGGKRRLHNRVALFRAAEAFTDNKGV